MTQAHASETTTIAVGGIVTAINALYGRQLRRGRKVSVDWLNGAHEGRLAASPGDIVHVEGLGERVVANVRVNRGRAVYGIRGEKGTFGIASVTPVALDPKGPATIGDGVRYTMRGQSVTGTVIGSDGNRMAVLCHEANRVHLLRAQSADDELGRLYEGDCADTWSKSLPTCPMLAQPHRDADVKRQSRPSERVAKHVQKSGGLAARAAQATR